MRNETRVHFDAYLAQQAHLNGVANGHHQFAVIPSVEQKLENRIRESSGFLQAINMYLVDEQKGEKLGMDVGTPVASTTDTDVQDRGTKDPTTLAGRDYECTQTDFDTHVKYSKLDQWAKFPDFQARMRNLILAQAARDRIMIGFNGTSRAATSDLATNTKLQDVNIGWLQHLRTDAPERVMTTFNVGDQAGSVYKNIDAAVMDVTDSLIDEWFLEDTELVCILGRKLLSDKYLGLVSKFDEPTERAALELMISNKQVGGLKTVRVPFFPPNSFMITPLRNLSLYAQSGSRRRKTEDNPKRNRIENYDSVNEAYVIEELGACALAEDIKVPDGAGGWQ